MDVVIDAIKTWLPIVFAGVLTWATIALWRATKRYARATDTLANATKKYTEATEELVKVNKKFQKATEVSTLVQMLINWATKMEIDEAKRPSFPWTGRREEVEQKIKNVLDGFLSDQ